MRVSFKTRFFALALTLGLGLTVAMGPASAQAVPGPEQQDVLIRSSLLTFNDANVTGNYTVFHDKLSKPFRDQFSADQLKEAFKAFHEKHIDIDVVAVKPITPTQGEVKLDDDGTLKLNGVITVNEKVKITYDLKFIRSEGDWKLSGINVKL